MMLHQKRQLPHKRNIQPGHKTDSFTIYTKKLLCKKITRRGNLLFLYADNLTSA